MRRFWLIIISEIEAVRRGAAAPFLRNPFGFAKL